MKNSEINIRDPFVLVEKDRCFMYGTRAKAFGKKTGGFDVYVSDDLENWSAPAECFNSAQYNMNRDVNWAPEVHKYNNAYYMFATFTKENGRRGTYVLKADNPLGPFAPHSRGAVTPDAWECLDGTLYVDKSGTPYLVFCHEHTQIIDGAVCCIQLRADLKTSVGEAVTLFCGSSPAWADKKPAGEHYITDGPFMFTTKNGTLLMIWSTFINGRYAQCVAKSQHGEITGEFTHLAPLLTDDGGHGMIFEKNGQLMLTIHTPNQTNFERPKFMAVEDMGDFLALKPPVG